MGENILCPKCGARIKETKRGKPYCENCGISLGHMKKTEEEKKK